MLDQESADWLCRSQVFQQRVQWAMTYNIAALQVAPLPSDAEGEQVHRRFVAFIKQPGYFASVAKVAADASLFARSIIPWPIRNVAWADEAAMRDHGYISDGVLLDATLAVMRADFEQAEGARKPVEVAAAEGAE
jgi:hypothetical protein